MGQEKSMFAENAAEKLRRHGEEAYGRKEYSINEWDLGTATAPS